MAMASPASLAGTPPQLASRKSSAAASAASTPSVVEAPLATFRIAAMYWCATMFQALPTLGVLRIESSVLPHRRSFSSCGAGQSTLSGRLLAYWLWFFQ